MDTLFDTHNISNKSAEHTSLALRMRPTSLEDFVGQQQALSSGSWLRRAIAQDALTSIILFGPAGTGKTSLARIIAHKSAAEFVEVSAIGGTVSDLRREIKAAQERLFGIGRKTILFIDEIHRFNRAQQDALLHAVENQDLILIGATTENPYFEINAALVSRSRIIEFCALKDEDLELLLNRALSSKEGLNGAFSIDDDARERLIISCGGDARFLLNTLEAAANLARHDGCSAISLEQLSTVAPRSNVKYDKNKDEHYDVVSAFIKSMRGSDAQATIYWLARMIDAGEDPKFIARRIFICASEDIGNADPQALLIAEAAFRAVEVIGYPECRINLAQAALYMALAPKSNTCEAAIDAALRCVKFGGAHSVPSHLRDRHRPGSEVYGAYKYPHNYEGGWVEQSYLPESLAAAEFAQFSERGWEAYRSEIINKRRARMNYTKKQN